MNTMPGFLDEEPFVPHDYEALVAAYAFPPESIPEPAYLRLTERYAQTTDVGVRRVMYRSDDLRISGILARPAGAPKGIVIYNRGGSGNYGMLTVHAVMRQFVPLARAGYLVAGSNYRGNDGSEGCDEFGGRDVDDVVALHTLVQSLAPEAPTFLLGHSRGGMMAFLLNQRKLPARATAVLGPVCDLREWNQFRSDMRERVYKRYIPDFETREQAAIAERSVVDWPEDIITPLLLLHGTDDDAVPHQQSEQLVGHLKALGKPHELMLYEGGNHALTRHWDDVLARVLNWFEIHG